MQKGMTTLVIAVLAAISSVGSVNAQPFPWVPPYGLGNLETVTAWIVPDDPVTGAERYTAASFGNLAQIQASDPSWLAATFNVDRIGFTSFGPGPVGGYPFYGLGSNLRGDVTNCTDPSHNPLCSPSTEASQAYNFQLGNFIASLDSVVGTVTYHGAHNANDCIGFGAVGGSGPCDSASGHLFMEITGNFDLSNGNHISIAHDDGVSLRLNPGTPNQVDGPFTSTIAPGSVEGWDTGLSGVVPFELLYSECCSAPAYITLHVPEPTSAALLSVGLVGFGVIRRRRKEVSPFK